MLKWPQLNSHSFWLLLVLLLFFSNPLFAQSNSPNTSWPVTNGDVRAIATDGNGTTYIGGLFTTVGGITRNRIAAISSTGAVTSWNPNANNDVYSIVVSGSTVYVGGAFSTIGGQTRNSIAALSTTSAAASAWDPNANSSVSSIVISGTLAYVGGNFTNIGGQARSRAAALDTTVNTNNATSWNPIVDNNSVSVIAVTTTTTYLGGTFTTFNAGASNRRGLAAVNTTGTGTLTSWNPSSNTLGNSVLAIVVSGTTAYVGGTFPQTMGGQTRNNIAAISTTSAVATSWNPNANNTVRSLSLDSTNSLMYAGGDFTTIGGQTRNYIAGLSTSTGSANSWNPNITTNPGVNTVYSILQNSSYIQIGGVFTTVNGTARANFAQFDFPTVTLSASPTTISEAGGVSTVTATLSASSSVNSTVELTFGGTATNITNYTRSATSITITAGSTTGAITITGVNDGVFNPSLTVIPNISTTTNTIIGTPSSATITITNVNSTPTLTLSASPSSITTTGGTSTVTATLSAVSGVNTVANLTYTGDAVRNTNYTASADSITITAGTTTGTVTLTRLTSPTVGPDLSIISTITSVDNNYATIGSPSSATVTLTNTTPSLSINNVTMSEDGGTMTFTVTLSQASSGTVTVDYATANGTAIAGVNYVATSGTLTFAPGETTQSISVTLINSSFEEGTTKTFTVTLSNPSGATILSSTGTGTIQGAGGGATPNNPLGGGGCGLTQTNNNQFSLSIFGIMVSFILILKQIKTRKGLRLKADS